MNDRKSPYDDYCDECRIYGDDISINEQGKMEDNCWKCPFNEVEFGKEDP